MNWDGRGGEGVGVGVGRVKHTNTHTTYTPFCKQYYELVGEVDVISRPDSMPE